MPVVVAMVFVALIFMLGPGLLMAARLRALLRLGVWLRLRALLRFSAGLWLRTPLRLRVELRLCVLLLLVLWLIVLWLCRTIFGLCPLRLWLMELRFIPLLGLTAGLRFDSPFRLRAIFRRARLLRNRLVAVSLIGVPSAVVTLRLIRRPRPGIVLEIPSDGPVGYYVFRAAMVAAVERIAVASSCVYVLRLKSRAIHVALVFRRALACIGIMVNATGATAKSYAAVTVNIVAVKVSSVVIGMVDDAGVDAPNGGVVVEEAIMPPAAEEANAEVAEAVVDAAIVADCRAPITGVPDVEAVGPTPITGRPKRTDVGRLDPCAGNPVIVAGIVVVGPIARRPDQAGLRAGRLHINGQRRRTKSHADEDSPIR